MDLQASWKQEKLERCTDTTNRDSTNTPEASQLPSSNKLQEIDNCIVHLSLAWINASNCWQLWPATDNQPDQKNPWWYDDAGGAKYSKSGSRKSILAPAERWTRCHIPPVRLTHTVCPLASKKRDAAVRLCGPSESLTQ